jgi:hypothetical protein
MISSFQFSPIVSQYSVDVQLGMLRESICISGSGFGLGTLRPAALVVRPPPPPPPPLRARGAEAARRFAVRPLGLEGRGSVDAERAGASAAAAAAGSSGLQRAL